MKAVVIGAGMGGLLSAVAFRRRGWEVTVLEADDDLGPDTHGSGETWIRRGTPHGRQAHAALGGFVRVLQELMPDALAELEGSGVVRRSAADLMPAPMSDRSPQPGDEEIRVIGARRPHIEWHVRRAALREPGIDWRFGAHVHGLAATGSTPPHIAGVTLDDGSTIATDVVIDASGRRSRAGGWLEEAGVRLPPAPSSPCGMSYHTRYYRLHDATEPMRFPSGHLLVVPYPTFVVLLFPGDNGYLQVAMGGLPGDATLRPIREPGPFHAVATMSPPIADWLRPDRAAPASDVAVYGTLNNRIQRLVADGEPVVTGFHFVGDSGAITNAQYGRGISHAAIHGAAVARIATETEEARAQARAVDAEVARMIEPSVRESMAVDAWRTGRWQALSEGREPPSEGPPLPEGLTFAHQMAAESSDPFVWRSIIRCNQVLEPPGSWRTRPDVLERIGAAEPAGVPMPTVEATRAVLARVESAIAAAR